MKPLEHCSLHCLYCDDVRNEVGGKTTVVGWYGPTPVELPAEGALLIPALSIVGVLAMPLEPRRTSMKMDLLLDQTVIQSVVFPDQAVEDMQTDDPTTSVPLIGRQARIAIRLNNFAVGDPCVLRMRVTLGEEEVYGNGLRFSRQPTP